MKIDLIEEAITGHWGERCKRPTEGCPICDAWCQFDDIVEDLKQMKADDARRNEEEKERAREMGKALKNRILGAPSSRIVD